MRGAAGVALADIDLFVYHQANTRILASLAERLGARPRRASSTASPTLGNTSAASVPLALDAGAPRRAAARRACACCSPPSGRASPGAARVVEWGLRVSPAPGRRGCALVTGGSRGIGAAIAMRARRRRLAGRGQLPQRRGGRAATVAAIEAAGGRAVALAGDVADPAAPARCSRPPGRRSAARCWRSSTTPACAPTASRCRSATRTGSVVLDTNLGATYRLTRAALRAMIRARFGRVVNIASVVGPRANAGQANYAASKAALIAFTKTAAVEVARRGVTINAVAPGLIETDMTEDIPDGAARAGAGAARRDAGGGRGCGRLPRLRRAPPTSPARTLYVDGGTVRLTAPRKEHVTMARTADTPDRADREGHHRFARSASAPTPSRSTATPRSRRSTSTRSTSPSSRRSSRSSSASS